MTDGPALITGIDHPLGLAIAERISREWNPLTIGGTDLDPADDLLESPGIVGIRTDPRDEFELERLAETASRTGDGTLGLVIPAARVRHSSVEEPVYETTYAAIDDELRTNLRGVYATIKEAIPHCDSETRLLIPIWDPSTSGGTYAAGERAVEQLIEEFASTEHLSSAGVNIGTPDPADPTAIQDAADDVFKAAIRPLDDYDGRIFESQR